MRQLAPIEVVVHQPKTTAGMTELSRRVSEVHCDMVNYKLQHLKISAGQKLSLLDTVIKFSGIRQKARER